MSIGRHTRHATFQQSSLLPRLGLKISFRANDLLVSEHCINKLLMVQVQACPDNEEKKKKFILQMSHTSRWNRPSQLKVHSLPWLEKILKSLFSSD